MWSFSARRSGLEVCRESRGAVRVDRPWRGSKAPISPCIGPPTPSATASSSTVSTTRGTLSPEISGTSGGIVAHRLTPRIATLSPKPSTERGPRAISLLVRLADSSLQKVEDRLECAIPDEILVTRLAGEPQLLGFRCCLEQRSAKAKRDDPVSLAKKDQDRRPDIADLRQRVRNGHAQAPTPV